MRMKPSYFDIAGNIFENMGKKDSDYKGLS
jgi:hypothetical protein